jgi:hypothetical protein
MKMVLRRTIP